MARLRRPHVRQEPIRSVDAVVVVRDPADRPAAEVHAPPEENVAAAVDDSRPPIATGSGPVSVDPHSKRDPSAPDFAAPTSFDDEAGAQGEPWLSADEDDTCDDEDIDPTRTNPADDGQGEVVVRAHGPAEAPRHDAAQHAYDDPAAPEPAEPALLPQSAIELYDDEDIDEIIPPTVKATTCTIAVWRGYRKATFYARAFDSRGGEVALAESPSFRYRGNGMPDQTQAAADAHRALLDALRHSGYEPAENGAAWFDVTLTRR